jgi:hypothetical protein
MSFINKETNVVINTKLTTLGRSLLANGNLNFSHFAIGDSEIDYNFIAKYGINPLDLRILKPVDKNPEIKHFVKPTPSSQSYRLPLSTPTPNAQSVTALTETKGFFTGSSVTNYTLKSDLIKGVSTIVSSSIDGNAIIELSQAINDLNPNDYLLIGWMSPEVGAIPSGNNISKNAIQYLWYKVVSINGKIVELDKNTPNMTTGSGKAYVFPSGQSLRYYYSNIFEREKIAPVWGLTIVYGRSMEGAEANMRASSYPSSAFIGFKNYLEENKANKALGVIHYTNFNKINEYGESLFKDSFVLELPTIMYHNKPTADLGVTLSSGAEVKLFTGGETGEFGTPYYDLLDPKGKAIGKVFIDFKVATIEDQELLAAMSMKSNRNWTLPDFKTFNSLSTETGADLYVTYQLVTQNGDIEYKSGETMGFVTALHAQNIHKVDSKTLNYLNFSFEADDFKFMKDSGSINGTGFQASRLLLLFQRVEKGGEPVHDEWVTYDFTPNLPNYSSWNGKTIPVSALAGETFMIKEEMITQAYNNALQNGNYNLNYLLPNLTEDNSNPFTLKGFGSEDNGPAI